jgi:uncharacterized protein YndB with AHSA1/START domain
MRGRSSGSLRAMTKVQQSVTIRRPVDEVWTYVIDARNDPIWWNSVVEAGRGAELPPAVGVEIEETFRFAGIRFPVRFKVTELEPATRSAVEVVGGPVPGRGSYDLEPVDGGTRLTLTLETDAHGFFKLAEPVFARMAQRDVAASCAKLKDVLEVGAS